jgi:hypothetical protein
MWPRDREVEIAWGQPCVCSYERIALPSGLRTNAIVG